MADSMMSATGHRGLDAMSGLRRQSLPKRTSIGIAPQTRLLGTASSSTSCEFSSRHLHRGPRAAQRRIERIEPGADLPRLV